MGMFSVGFCEATPPRSILDILSDTLIIRLSGFFVYRGISKVRADAKHKPVSMLNLGLRGNRKSDGTE